MRPPRALSLDALNQRHGPRYKWLLLITVATGTIAGVLATSAFNVAITALSQQFGLGHDQVQWAVTGFMAAMTLSMLPTSWLLDRIGFRRLFLAAVAVLTLASVAGSLAQSFGEVVLARVLQGAAAGILQPLGTLVVLRLFPPHMQGRASGLLTLGLVITPAVAPAFGGVLVDHFGWAAIFLLNTPFCLAALALGAWLLPAPSPGQKHPFDWTGALLLSLATLAVVDGVTSLHRSGVLSAWTAAHAALALLTLAAFVRHARRSPAPLIQLSLFGSRTFTMGSVVSFTYGFGLYGSTYLIPVFLQSALGYTATAAGNALIPGGIALMLSTPLAGRLTDRYPPKAVAIGGLLLFGGSFFAFYVLGQHIGYAALIAATVVGRIGLGMILPALNLATLRHLAPHQLAQSSVIVTYARQLGGVFGIAMTAVFVEWREGAYRGQAGGLFTAYGQGFFLLGAVVLGAMLAALLMRGQAPAAVRTEA